MTIPNLTKGLYGFVVRICDGIKLSGVYETCQLSKMAKNSLSSFLMQPITYTKAKREEMIE